jgi:hypothetical protein
MNNPLSRYPALAAVFAALAVFVLLVGTGALSALYDLQVAAVVPPIAAVVAVAGTFLVTRWILLARRAERVYLDATSYYASIVAVATIFTLIQLPQTGSTAAVLMGGLIVVLTIGIDLVWNRVKRKRQSANV